MCVCVCVCVCFGNMCTCIYCVLYCFVYVYLFSFVLSVPVQGLLPPSDTSTAVGKKISSGPDLNQRPMDY